MDIVSLLVLSASLSMDAFAVSVSSGVSLREKLIPRALLMAAFFGAFQALMPLLGWLLGTLVSDMIRKIDHWIAFALLSYIGVSMIVEGVRCKGEEVTEDTFSIQKLFLLAIATSIDALAVGITFAFFHVNILLAALVIGSVTFAVCFVGVVLGRQVGKLLKKCAPILGGVALIGIGVKILLEHLLA